MIRTNYSFHRRDYKPTLWVKKGAMDFGKGTSRPDIAGRLKDMTKDPHNALHPSPSKAPAGTPGPGSYNLSGGGGGIVHQQRPGPARKKNAVFSSKVARLKERIRKESQGPSPQTYNIPSTLKVADRPDAVQCFGTSSDRYAPVLLPFCGGSGSQGCCRGETPRTPPAAGEGARAKQFGLALGRPSSDPHPPPTGSRPARAARARPPAATACP
jgi:hypothetical protein